MYKNIIFDFYGTLVDYKVNELTEDVWNKLSYFMTYRKAPYSAEELEAAFQKSVKKQLLKFGDEKYPEADLSDVFYKLYLDKGVKVKPRQLKDTMILYKILLTEHLQLYSGVEQMLQDLKKKGCRLYLLSNAQLSLLDMDLKMFGLSDMFDGVYTSSDHHLAKPSPKLFNKLLKKENLDKSKTVMVGNEYSTDIKGAGKAGIDSLFILTDTSDRKAKKEESTYAIMDGDHSKIIKVLTKG